MSNAAADAYVLTLECRVCRFELPLNEMEDLRRRGELPKYPSPLSDFVRPDGGVDRGDYQNHKNAWSFFSRECERFICNWCIEHRVLKSRPGHYYGSGYRYPYTKQGYMGDLYTSAEWESAVIEWWEYAERPYVTKDGKRVAPDEREGEVNQTK